MLPVRFPAVGDFVKGPVSRELCHDSQLYDMQAMVERAGEHFEASSGLLIERPVASIKAREVVNERFDSAIENVFRRRSSARHPEIVNAPQRPDKTIQDVGRWIDEILFDPQVDFVVHTQDTSLGDGAGQCYEGAIGGLTVLCIASLRIHAKQE